jgi:hypothetical protein
MNTKPLLSVLAFAGVLVVGFSASPVALFGGSPVAVASAESAGIEELRYLPADAALVAYADVENVLGSSLWLRLQELRPEGQQGRQRFRESTGIDLATDVDRVVAAMFPVDGGDGTTVALAVIKGRFDKARVESFARQRGGIQEDYRDTRLITERTGDRTRAVAFLAPDLMAIGDSTAVRRAIDTRHGEDDVTGNADMMTRIAGVANGASLWAVGSFEALASRASLFESVPAQVPRIEFFSAFGRVNDGVVGSIQAEAEDDEAAVNLRNVIEKLLATARLQASSKPGLLTMLESFELGQSGNTVALSFNLTPQFFESLTQQQGQMTEQ